MKKLLLFLCILLTLHAAAQTQKIAALRKAVRNERDPARRFAVLLRLLDEHESIYKDSLGGYIDHAYALARQLNTKYALLSAGAARVNMLLRFDRSDEAMQLADSLLQQADSNNAGEKALYIKLSLQKMNSYAAASKYEVATEMLYRILAMAEREKDTLSQAQCMNALGVIAYNLDKLDDDIRWCRKVKALCGDHERFNKARAYCYINTASYFAWIENFDSATYYINQAFPVCENTQNLYYLANAYIIESDIYKWSKRLEKAEQSMRKAIAIRRQTEGNITFSNEQLALANLYRNMHQYDKAIVLFSEGVRYAKDSLRAKGNELNYDILLQYYKGLSNCYGATGDHASYEASLENIIEVKDTLNKFNSEKALAEMQTKYDVQLKDNTIIRQKLDITRKDFLFYGSLVVLALSLVIAWLLFRNYSRRQKMKIYFMQEEEKRKAVWAVKEAGEKERKRIAADLHDNMGSYAAGIKANVEELMLQAQGTLPAMEHLRSNAQQMVALLGDTIWALKKEELSLSAISDRLKVFVQRLRSSHPHISFGVKEEIVNDLKLPPVQAYHLFMMVQEAVNNAVRHSEGNEIIIAMSSDDTWVISVADNGRGMSDARAPGEGGNGCYNIRMRAQESGWHVAWMPVQPHGTRVVISNIN